MARLDHLTFAELLRHYRSEAGFSQEELAELTGLSVDAIGRHERGERQRPHRHTVRLYAEALHLSADERALFEAAARPPTGETGAPERKEHPSFVPLFLTAFVGRTREMAEISRLLSQERVRLLTLLGPGGIGKTRLVVQVAMSLQQTYPDGVYFVDLASISDHTLVPSTIAAALGIPEVRSQALRETLQGALRSKQLLLILDNFEHLLVARDLISALLVTCPLLSIVVTSRSVLRLTGEREYPVPPLALPDPRSGTDLTQYDAVALFVERVRAIKPEFAVTAETAPVLAEICARLDGLPLAIELAAARIRLFSPQALLGRLAQRFTLLTGGARDQRNRQQTLRGAIDWSFELLTTEERRLFAQLSVFAGGWSYEAAEAVYEEDPGLDLLERLESLVEQSMVYQGEDARGDARFGMLETMREYARERLEKSGEVESIRWRHARYYAMLAEDAALGLIGPDQMMWGARLDREHDNLRAVLGWSLDGGDVTMGQRLAGCLWRFWSIRGYVGEGRQWLRAALARGDFMGHTSVRARALIGAAMLSLDQAALDEAAALCTESIALAQESGDHQILAQAHYVQGILVRQQGNYADAIRWLEEAISLAERIGDRSTEAGARANLGIVLDIVGDGTRAGQLFEQSLALFRALGDLRGQADVLVSLTRRTDTAGAYQQAEALGDEALTLFRTLGDSGKTAEALFNLAILAQYQGQWERAQALLEECIALRNKRGDHRGVSMARSVLARIALVLGDEMHARRLVSEALETARASNDRWGLSIQLTQLGHVEMAAGNVEGATALFAESAELFQTLGSTMYLSWCLEGLAAVAVAQERWQQAAHLCGARTGLLEHITSKIPPAHPIAYTETVTAIRTALGEEMFETHQMVGSELSLDQVIADALETVSESADSLP